MKKGTRVKRRKLKVGKRIFSKLDKMRKSSIHKGTIEVLLIASLHHCNEVQCMTQFCPFLLFWEVEAHSLLYAGQSRMLSTGFETFKTIKVKNIF